MNEPTPSQSMSDLMGRKIAAQLSFGCTGIEHDIVERLRVARLQAVQRRKTADVVVATRVAVAGGAAALHYNENKGFGWWAPLASALPLLALVAGLLAIYVIQNDNRANEVAEIDAALLTDDLPTAAYTDPGFMQFLQADSTSSSNP